MSARILKWSQIESPKESLKSVKEIFFLSSNRKDFLNDAEKQRFFEKWTQYYFDFCADSILVAIDKTDGQVLGYLTGCEDSHKAAPLLLSAIPSYEAFSDQFDQYSCHLHMNLHPNARGRGIGSQLIQEYKAIAKSKGASGLHIVTAPNAQNVSFYKKNGLTAEIERDWKGYKLLFLGERF